MVGVQERVGGKTRGRRDGNESRKFVDVTDEGLEGQSEDEFKFELSGRRRCRRFSKSSLTIKRINMSVT